MNEKADKELLNGALDDTLSDAEAARLRERLAADPALRAESVRLRELQQALEEAGPADPPDDLVNRVMAAVSVRERDARARGTERRLEVTGAARQLWDWVACHLSGSTPGSELTGMSGFNGGGAIVAKKTLWAVAGVAVAAILVFVYFNGTRSVDQGVEGTIAGANRAVGAQPASVNVPTGDVQAFLQTDTFNKILKNKELRGLLADPAACAILANGSAEAALKDPQVQAAMADVNVMAAVRSASLQAALADDSVQAALADAEVQAAIRQVSVQSALGNEYVEAALNDGGARAALADADVMAALRNEKLFAQLVGQAQSALRHAGLKEQVALKPEAALGGQAKIQAAMQNQAFLKFVALAPQAQVKPFLSLMAQASVRAAMIKGDAMANLFTDDAVQAAMHGETGIAQLIGNQAFMAAIKDSQSALAQARLKDPSAALHAEAKLGGFAALVSQAGIQAAMRDGSLPAALNNPAFAALMQNQSALQAALAKQQ